MTEHILPCLAALSTGYVLGELFNGHELARSVAHRTRTALAGCGLAIAFATGVAVLAALQRQALPLLWPAVAGCLSAWLIGQCQEWFELPGRARDVALILLALTLTVAGIAVSTVRMPISDRYANLGWWAIPLSAAWLFLVTKSFLVVRPLSGLVTGLGCVVPVTLFIITTHLPHSEAQLATALALIVAGASCGLFRFTVRPDAQPVGAGGSALIGMSIAIITVTGAVKNTVFLVIVLPLLTLGAPILNTTYAFVRRPTGSKGQLAITRRRECLHDVLLRAQLPPHRVSLFFVAVDAYLCLIALLVFSLSEAHFLIRFLLLVSLLLNGWLLFYSIAKVQMRTITAGEEDGGEIQLFNVAVDPVSVTEAVRRIEAFVDRRQPHMVVTSDASAIIKAQHDPELQTIINEADLVTADGVGVLWSARVLDQPLFERVPGVELVDHLCALAARRQFRVFFLGAAPGVARQAADNLARRHPGLPVAGVQHGYFAADEEPEIVATIRRSRTDLLFVALGIPKQEKWIKRHLSQLGAAVCIGVGGSFDIYSGRLTRAPEWMQRAGLEWLYRVLLQPSRIRRLGAIPQIIWLTLRQWTTRFVRRKDSHR